MPVNPNLVGNLQSDGTNDGTGILTDGIAQLKLDAYRGFVPVFEHYHGVLGAFQHMPAVGGQVVYLPDTTSNSARTTKSGGYSAVSEGVGTNVSKLRYIVEHSVEIPIRSKALDFSLVNTGAGAEALGAHQMYSAIEELKAYISEWAIANIVMPTFDNGKNSGTPGTSKFDDNVDDLVDSKNALRDIGVPFVKNNMNYLCSLNTSAKIEKDETLTKRNESGTDSLIRMGQLPEQVRGWGIIDDSSKLLSPRAPASVDAFRPSADVAAGARQIPITADADRVYKEGTVLKERGSNYVIVDEDTTATSTVIKLKNAVTQAHDSSTAAHTFTPQGNSELSFQWNQRDAWISIVPTPTSTRWDGAGKVDSFNLMFSSVPGMKKIPGGVSVHKVTGVKESLVSISCMIGGIIIPKYITSSFDG